MNAAPPGRAETLGASPPDAPQDFESYVRAGQRHHKRLAFLLTGDLDQAEDLLQAAYAKVYPRWAKISTYDVPDAYLRRVMVNLRTSWWRRSRNREVAVAELPQRVVASVPDPAEQLAESAALLAALQSLPDRQRAAVVLRHWCDLSEAETAAAMKCSVGTVKSSTNRGLAHLRTALAEAGGRAS